MIVVAKAMMMMVVVMMMMIQTIAVSCNNVTLGVRATTTAMTLMLS